MTKRELIELISDADDDDDVVVDVVDRDGVGQKIPLYNADHDAGEITLFTDVNTTLKNVHAMTDEEIANYDCDENI